MGDDNDYSNEDYEEEEHEHSLDVNGTCPVPIKLRIRMRKYNEENLDDCFHTSSIQCTYSGRYIGGAKGTHVRRIRFGFLDSMSRASPELSAVAWDIFDRYGYLKRQIREHPIRQGMRVWGNELDDGPFFVLERVLVDKEWRGKALGRTMVSLLVRKVLTRTCPGLDLACKTGSLPLLSQTSPETPAIGIPHIFVCPGVLNSDIKREMEGKPPGEERKVRFEAFSSANAFYRSLGFRRVGMTSVFGFSLHPKHLSHSLLAAEDSGTRYQPTEGNDSNWVDLITNSDEDFSQEEFPLHHAAYHLPDASCVETVEQHSAQGFLNWNSLNNVRDNLLHITAWKHKPLSTKWLLQYRDSLHKLSATRNDQGYTPLELLEAMLEGDRVQGKDDPYIWDASDSFSGFPPDAVECLAALRGVSENLQRIERLRLKYGCDCGKCIGGFISTRMRVAILHYSKVFRRMLQSCVDDETLWLWLAYHNGLLRNVDELQAEFRTNRTSRQAFTDIFEHIFTCISTDIVPSRNSISALDTDIRTGWLQEALQTLLQYAAEQDKKVGNGIFDEAAGDNLKFLSEHEWVCRNDHEFGFVSRVFEGFF